MSDIIRQINEYLLDEINNKQFASAIQYGFKTKNDYFFKSLGCTETRNYQGDLVIDPISINDQSLFDLASVTKIFLTTYSIMLLIDRNKLTVDDKIHQFFDFTEMTDESKNISIYDLLTHSSGLPQWYPLYVENISEKDIVHFILNLPADYLKGTARKYSDLGFIILGKIIEKVSGHQLEIFFENNFLIPLKLHHSAFNPSQKKYSSIVSTSQGNPFEEVKSKQVVSDAIFNSWRKYTLKGEVNDGNCYHVLGGIAGHCGLFSNADNCLKLLNLFFDPYFFSQKTKDLFISKHLFNNSLGFASDDDVLKIKTKHVLVGHHGFTGCTALLLPQYQGSFIFLSNRQHYGLKEGNYPDWKVVASNVFQMLESKFIV